MRNETRTRNEGDEAMNRTVIIRETKTDELRLVPVKPGQVIAPQAGYRFAGPFRSEAAARRLLRQGNPALRAELYGDVAQRTVITE